MMSRMLWAACMAAVMTVPVAWAQQDERSPDWPRQEGERDRPNQILTPYAKPRGQATPVPPQGQAPSPTTPVVINPPAQPVGPAAVAPEDAPNAAQWPQAYEPKEKLDLTKSGQYRQGQWTYFQEITTKDGQEHRQGNLFYGDQRLERNYQYPYTMRTPWGYMMYFGNDEKGLRDGWQPVSVEEIRRQNGVAVASPLAAGRATALLENLDSFQMRLVYERGREGAALPSLTLAVGDEAGRGAPAAGVRQVNLTKEQARDLIGHMAVSGLLDEGQAGEVQPQGRGYVLHVTGGAGQSRVDLKEFLPWGQEMLSQLNAIEETLQTPAARQMGNLVDTVAEESRLRRPALGRD